MIINNIVAFLKRCPLLEEYKIKVDYLGETAGNCTVYPLPCAPVVKRYTDGGQLKQYLFAFASREYIDATDESNVKNQIFYEEFSKWLDEKSDKGELPDIEEGTVQSIEAVDQGYLLSDDKRTGAYQIQCRLKYLTD